MDSIASWNPIAIGRHQIIQGDCSNVLRLMPSASIDVVVFSLPWNIGVSYRSYDDRKPREVNLDWMGESAAQLHRVLKPTGSVFLNVGATSQDPWVMYDVGNLYRSQFVLQNHIVWVKWIICGVEIFAPFKPIGSRRFLNHNHESIFHFTVSGEVPIDRLAVGVP